MTTYTYTHHELSEDDFLARFKPVPNHIDPSGGFDGCMFETFGEELAHVQAQDRNFVWTMLDCDGQLRIESGFHFVNRLGYLIATVPTEPDHTYSVACEDLTEHDNEDDDRIEHVEIVDEREEGGAP